jgi:hypothetical protein
MTVQGRHGAEAGTEELRQEVDRARHELGDTVELLAAKADVKALAREKAEQARVRARDAAASAWQAAGSEQAIARLRLGGAVAVSAGAVGAAALWVRRRRASSRPVLGPVPGRMARSMSWRTARRSGPVRMGPVRLRFTAGQRRAVKVRRGKRH